MRNIKQLLLQCFRAHPGKFYTLYELHQKLCLKGTEETAFLAALCELEQEGRLAIKQSLQHQEIEMFGLKED